MSEIVENFKKEYSEDFYDINLLPDTIIETSEVSLVNLITQRRTYGESKIFINVYYKDENIKDHLQIESSKKYVGALLIADIIDVEYELLFEHSYVQE